MREAGLPGQQLRSVRTQLRLSMRDVEEASSRLAERCGNRALVIPPSRLSDIETKGIVPSIYRVYSLAVIYRLDMREILCWYGLNLYDDVFAGRRAPQPEAEPDSRP